MNINFANKNEINNIYVHDSIYEGFTYTYNQRTIEMNCKNFYLHKEFHFQFNNVIFCEMQSCSFWRGGNYILNISLEENSQQLNDLLKLQSQHKDLYKGSYLDREINYLSIRVEINSGDTMLIICENVDFVENDMVQ